MNKAGILKRFFCALVTLVTMSAYAGIDLNQNEKYKLVVSCFDVIHTSLWQVAVAKLSFKNDEEGFATSNIFNEGTESEGYLYIKTDIEGDISIGIVTKNGENILADLNVDFSISALALAPTKNFIKFTHLHIDEPKTGIHHIY